MTYHSRYPIATIFSAVKELIKYANINRASYTQIQAMNIRQVWVINSQVELHVNSPEDVGRV